MKFKLIATAACMTTAMLVGGHAAAQEKLTVWWAKGYYKAEDDALFAAIKKFEAKTKVKVELSQYAPQEANLLRLWMLKIHQMLPMLTSMTSKSQANGRLMASWKISAA